MGDTMKIMHNVPAWYSHRQLTLTNRRLAKSTEKLSSGLRINRAADDAAGLAVSEKLRTQVNGLEVAQRNTQDGISLIQTAEAGLQELQDILQRMRSLSIQASNDTLTSRDRDFIQYEISQLLSEIDRMQTTVIFNTRQLLTGAYGHKYNWGTGANAVTCSSSTSYKLAGPLSNAAGTGVGSLNNNALSFSTSSLTEVQFRDGNTEFTGGSQYSVDYNRGVVYFSNDPSAANISFDYEYGAKGIKNSRLSVPANTLVTSNVLQTSPVNTLAQLELGGAVQKTTTTASLGGYGDITITKGGTTLEEVIFDNGSSEFAGTNRSNQYSVDYEKGIIHFASSTVAKGSTITSAVEVGEIETNALKMHVGANSNQTLEVAIASFSTTGLGLHVMGEGLNSSVQTQSGAESAIGLLTTAINEVSRQRAELGAYQNRLEHTYNFIGISKEEQESSESRIRDVDFGAEMIKYTKDQILMQASQSMLMQANMRPQSVLQLFG